MTRGAEIQQNPRLAEKRNSSIAGWMALLCLVMQFRGEFWMSAVALGLWLLNLLAYDRLVLRRMWLPRFWFATLVFALASGLVLGPRDIELGGIAFSLYGLEAGGLMIARGAFIFGLVMWASRNLNFGHVQRLAQRVGMEKVTLAVQVALGLIPVLKDRLAADFSSYGTRPGVLAYPRKIVAVARHAVVRTAMFAEQMAERGGGTPGLARIGKHMESRPYLAAVVGQKGVGKTAALQKLIASLEEAGYSVGGVIQPGIFEDGAKIGYNLLDPSDNSLRPFAQKREKKAPGQMGFAFDPKGWFWAAQRIAHAKTACNVLVVDELGLLEAQGKGHIRALLDPPQDTPKARLYLLGVRALCDSEIEQQLGRFDHVFHVEDQNASIEIFLKKLQRSLSTSNETNREES